MARQPQQQIDLNENPSAEEEADEQFSTADERADQREKEHEISVLKMKQGLLGGIIGSSDASLNFAFFLAILGGIALLLACGSLYFYKEDQSSIMQIIERIVAFELAVGAYIFGKNSD